MDDSRIVDLYLLRDEEAIRETAEKYGSRLRALAQGIVCDRQAAEECENDTYMETWNSIPPHEPRTYFYAFLARIARHIALNCCRDRSRLKRSAFLCELSREMEACIPGHWQETDVRSAEISRLVSSFLWKQTADNRMIFVRRYWYGDSVSEIALRYEISQSAVLMRLSRMREKLAVYLKKEGFQV